MGTYSRLAGPSRPSAVRRIGTNIVPIGCGEKGGFLLGISGAGNNSARRGLAREPPQNPLLVNELLGHGVEPLQPESATKCLGGFRIGTAAPLPGLS